MSMETDPIREHEALKEALRKEAQETIAWFSSECKEGQTIALEVSPTPFQDDSPGMLLEHWDTHGNVGVIGLYLSDDPEALARVQRLMPFLSAHEVAHLFNHRLDVFLQTPGQTVIDESLESEHFSYPMMHSGQRELLTDLTAYVAAPPKAKPRMLDAYINFVDLELIRDPHQALRDDFRILTMLAWLQNLHNDPHLPLASERIQQRLNVTLATLPETDQRLAQIYQQLLRDLLRQYDEARATKQSHEHPW